MTAYQYLTLAFYAALTAFAVAATWRHRGMRQVGVTLACCWVASNFVALAFPITLRPAFFPLLDTLFALTAAKAGKETGSRVPIILIALSVVAVIANTAFSILGAVSWQQMHNYEIAVNLIFALQCLVTGAWGVADAASGVVRVPDRARRLWGRSQSVAGSIKDSS